MEKVQMLAMIQAYSAVGIGLIIGLGALGACVGVASCVRASWKAPPASRN